MSSHIAASLALLLAALPLVAACGGGGDAPPMATRIGGSMILATTTSTQDSGLLDLLEPLFEAQTGIDLKVIAVGSGAALEMAARGDADAVLAHSPAAESARVASGDLSEGRLVMHNDVVLVGPPADPARAKGSPSLDAAMSAVAARGPFISRGDDSGTHKKELDLWRTAAIDPASVKQREETGQGMGATLNIASQKRAYTLTDRATYLALRPSLELEVVFEGALALLNIYHVYIVNPAKHPGVKSAQARAWAAFMVAPETQRAIASFGIDKYGEPLFVADGGKAEASLREP
ncbi:MAG: substrate-binding domain-containing protein [Tepidiformaceae bacterium]